jgi:hypothetical protein
MKVRITERSILMRVKTNVKAGGGMVALMNGS